jgi:hypothetical protein
MTSIRDYAQVPAVEKVKRESLDSDELSRVEVYFDTLYIPKGELAINAYWSRPSIIVELPLDSKHPDYEAHIMVTLHLGRRGEIAGEMVGRFRRIGEQSWDKGFYAQPYAFQSAEMFHATLPRAIADADTGIAQKARSVAEVRISRAYGDFNPETGFIQITHKNADGDEQFVFIRLSEIRQVWDNGLNVADYTYYVSKETSIKVRRMLMDVCGVVDIPTAMFSEPQRMTNPVDNMPVPGSR